MGQRGHLYATFSIPDTNTHLWSVDPSWQTSTRVQSKNLFNFRPQGFVDEDIVAFYEKMKTDFNIDMHGGMVRQSEGPVRE